METAQHPCARQLHDLVASAITLKSDEIRGEAKAIEYLHAYAETFPFLKSHKTFKAIIALTFVGGVVWLFGTVISFLSKERTPHQAGTILSNALVVSGFVVFMLVLHASDESALAMQIVMKRIWFSSRAATQLL